MHIIAVMSEKGGAGKTTLAVHLATAAHLAGQGVAILDLDPQGSAYAWAERRSEPPEAQAITPVALTGWLGKLLDNETDFVVIDTGRDANNAGYLAAKAADLILIPLRSGGFDFLALKPTLDLCRLAGKRPYIVMNAMRPNSPRIEADTRDALAGMDCEIAPVILHDRADYRAASVAALSAQELEPTGKAAAEIAALYSWILQHFDTLTTRQPNEATL